MRSRSLQLFLLKFDGVYWGEGMRQGIDHFVDYTLVNARFFYSRCYRRGIV